MTTPVLILTLFACSEEPPPEPVKAAPAPMALTVTGGSINVVTVKDGNAEVPGRVDGVTGSFRFEDGALTKDLSGDLSLDLSSWNSDLEERDNNVKKHFFDMASHGTATFSLTKVDGIPEEGIVVGSDADVDAEGWLKMHGAEVAVKTKVKIKRSAEKEFEIDSVEPFYVSIDDLGMTDRLKALIGVCGHQSVDNNVKINVNLSLGPKGAPMKPKVKRVPKAKAKAKAIRGKAKSKGGGGATSATKASQRNAR